MNRSKSLLLLFAVVFCSFLTATAQTNAPGWIWTKDGHGKPEAMAKDAADNLYYCGYYLNDSVLVEGVRLPNSGTMGFFVVKYTPDGSLVWAKSYAADQPFSFVHSINIDKTGNLYLSGTFSGSITLGNDTLQADLGIEPFLIKLSNSGDVIWGRVISGPGDYPPVKCDIGIDDSCNVYTGGYFEDSVSFDSNRIYSDTEAVYIAKYDSAGKYKWAVKYDIAHADHLIAVTADSAGNMYCAGNFQDSLRFGNILLNAGMNQRIFIAKHDRNGNLLWAKSSMNSFAGELSSLTLDRTGNIFATGYFYDAFSFAGNTISPIVDRNIFLAKYDNNGNELWARVVTDSAANSFDISFDVTTDTDGNPYVAGTFNGNNGIVSKFSAAGNRLWLKNGTPGTPNMSIVHSLCAGTKGNAYALGRIPNGGMTLRKLEVFPVTITDIKQAPVDLHLYPNPANTHLTISSQDAFEEVKIYDITGKTVLSKKTAKTKEITIDIEGLVRGVYLLEAGDGVKGKFIKE